MATQLLPVASKDNSSWFPKSLTRRRKRPRKNCSIEKKYIFEGPKNKKYCSNGPVFSKKETALERKPGNVNVVLD